MKIGELATRAGCQTVTVRFYERKGLLEAPQRSDANYRVYGQPDLDRLAFIRNCRALGLTLPEIKRLTAVHDDPTLKCDEVNACLDKHLSDVEKQLASLEQLKGELARLRSSCTIPGLSPECGVLAALTANGRTRH